MCTAVVAISVTLSPGLKAKLVSKRFRAISACGVLIGVVLAVARLVFILASNFMPCFCLCVELCPSDLHPRFEVG